MKTKPHFAGQITVSPFLYYLLMTLLIVIVALPLLLLNQCQSNKTATTEAGAPAFHKWAPTPPMGWNSWDCYGPTVVETEVKANEKAPS